MAFASIITHMTSFLENVDTEIRGGGGISKSEFQDQPTTQTLIYVQWGGGVARTWRFNTFSMPVFSRSSFVATNSQSWESDLNLLTLASSLTRSVFHSKLDLALQQILSSIDFSFPI